MHEHQPSCVLPRSNDFFCQFLFCFVCKPLPYASLRGSITHGVSVPASQRRFALSTSLCFFPLLSFSKIPSCRAPRQGQQHSQRTPPARVLTLLYSAVCHRRRILLPRISSPTETVVVNGFRPTQPYLTSFCVATKLLATRILQRESSVPQRG